MLRGAEEGRKKGARRRGVASFQMSPNSSCHGGHWTADTLCRATDRAGRNGGKLHGQRPVRGLHRDRPDLPTPLQHPSRHGPRANRGIVPPGPSRFENMDGMNNGVNGERSNTQTDVSCGLLIDRISGYDMWRGSAIQMRGFQNKSLTITSDRSTRERWRGEDLHSPRWSDEDLHSLLRFRWGGQQI